MSAVSPELHDSRVDGDAFREAISRFASGVTVVTTRFGDTDYGTTASAVSSLSLEPPMLLICLNRSSSTQEAVRESGLFAVNVLDDSQADLAHRFARKSADKFDGVPVERGAGDVPVLPDSLAHFECRVFETATAGTHIVFLAEVIGATGREGRPLTYFRGQFGRFEDAAQQRAFHVLRDLVVSRRIGIDSPLGPDEVARLLDTDRADAYYALIRLEIDDLLLRDDDGRFTVKPLSASDAAAAIEARRAIEQSIVDGIVENAGDAELDRLAELADEVAASVAPPSPDLTSFLAAARAFHEYFVALSRNAYLEEFHRRLAIHSIWLSALTGTQWVDLVDPRRFERLARTLRARDAAGAHEQVATAALRLSEMATGVIASGGGSL